ncbi:MAG: MSMEG_1061 family FMN-dependent PPOX-type flavoprotein [Stappiaceae bacterium]
MSAKETLFSRFNNPIQSSEDLEMVVGKPMDNTIEKEVHHLDEICRDFIAASPFCLMATADPDGFIDISPKGDPEGFVQVLDDNLLAIPDRPGNRRADTFHNVMKDPRMGLIFFIPGKGETLRVNGEARIVQDEALCQSMAVKGKAPRLAVLLYVERAFMHCPKCMIRSHMWQPDAWTDSSAIPDIGTAIIKQAHLDTTLEKLTAEVEKQGGLDLY